MLRLSIGSCMLRLRLSIGSSGSALVHACSGSGSASEEVAKPLTRHADCWHSTLYGTLFGRLFEHDFVRNVRNIFGTMFGSNIVP